MKINLYENCTLLDATKDMLGAIDNSDFSVEHIIVVPDRFSLQCEKLVLDLLPCDAFFNVRVVNLTALSVELLSKLGVNLKKENILSRGESLLLTQQAIENVWCDLLTLKKKNISFCYEISKLISQFKSSSVDPDGLNDKAKGNTGNKYHDLALIYKEYQSLLGDSLDANGRLATLTQKLKESDVLKNTKIYFAQFEAFTKEGYGIIKSFVECANEVNISFTKSLSIGNDYIYEKDIFQKLKNMSVECGAVVEVKSSKETLLPQKEAIVRGVYSYEKVYCENKGYYNLYSAISVSEEVESIAKLIRYFVFKGKQYSDMQIAIGGLKKYQAQIENIFDRYDIPYYIDSSITADNTILGNFVINLFETVVFGYSQDKLLSILSSPLLEDNSLLIDKCQKFLVDGKRRYRQYIEKDFSFAGVLKQIEKCKNAKDFEGIIINVLDTVAKKFESLMERLEECGDLKERNINIQLVEILTESAALISSYEKHTLDAGEYLKKLKLILSFKEVSTVPTYLDGVMIGDASESSFVDKDILFVVGCENLPLIASDNGILTDDELKLNYSNRELEPSIRMINRRNRFKLFNLLSLGKEKLFLTYQLIGDEGKKNEIPSFVKSLNSIFGQVELKCGNVFFNKRPHNKEAAILCSSPNEETSQDKKSLTIRNKISIDGRKFFFDGDKTRVTQLENYFSCPFKHFVNYGLKLKEFEFQKLDPRDLGNICHRGAQTYVNIRKHTTANIDIKTFVDEKFEQILQDENLTEKFEHLVEKESAKKFVKNQLTSLLTDIERELEKSQFKPLYTEKSFGDFKIGDDLTLIGKVDRIDGCGDYIRIIDYKTGHTGSLLKELYYGEKLQLFLYQKIASIKLGKVPAGVFYFNAKFNYSSDGEEPAVLKGLVENDEKLIPLFDEDIEEKGKSSLMAIKRSAKTGSFSGAAISKYSMKCLSDYAEKVASKATEEIIEGYIEPKPRENSCRWCKYASLCGYESSKGRRKDSANIKF